jgi:hypothetical protein
MTKRKLLMMVGFSILVVACGGGGGLEEGPDDGIRLPPAWTPTAVAVPGGGADEGTWLPCDNAPASQLQIGDNAVLDDGIEFAIRLRSEPGLTGTITSTITQSDILEVVGGPACYDHLVWWEIRSIGTGTAGWTAEGNSFGAWVLRVD